MRAAIYDRFWHSQGGGERHCGMIGEVLSQDGVEVDFLGHTEVDSDELADHLGLDLSEEDPDRAGQGRSRGRGDSASTTCSSTRRTCPRLPPRAHYAYLCFFPTPFDADLAPWRRRDHPPAWASTYRDRRA